LKDRPAAFIASCRRAPISKSRWMASILSTRKGPRCSGTESTTLSWRGVDSNFQYAEAVKRVVAAFSETRRNQGRLVRCLNLRQDLIEWLRRHPRIAAERVAEGDNTTISSNCHQRGFDDVFHLPPDAVARSGSTHRDPLLRLGGLNDRLLGAASGRAGHSRPTLDYRTFPAASPRYTPDGHHRADTHVRDGHTPRLAGYAHGSGHSEPPKRR
jgi:hypothetical protein